MKSANSGVRESSDLRKELLEVDLVESNQAKEEILWRSWVLPNDTSMLLKIISSKEKLGSWDLISAFRLQFLIPRILLKMKVGDMQFPGSTEVEMVSTCCSHLQHQRLSLGCSSPSLTPTMSLTPSLWAVLWLVDQEAHVSVSVTWGRHPAHRDQGWSESEPTLEPASFPNTDHEANLLRKPTKDALAAVSEILLRLHSRAERRHHFSTIDLLQAAVSSLGSIMLPAKCALIPRSRMRCSVVQTIWLRWHRAARKLFTEREKGRQIHRGL